MNQEYIQLLREKVSENNLEIRKLEALIRENSKKISETNQKNSEPNEKKSEDNRKLDALVRESNEKNSEDNQKLDAVIRETSEKISRLLNTESKNSGEGRKRREKKGEDKNRVIQAAADMNK